MSEGLMQVIQKLQEDNKKLRMQNDSLVAENALLQKRQTQESMHKAGIASSSLLSISPEMLVTINHELRTPMNAILGMLALALREQLNPKLRNYLETVQDSSYGLLEIVRNIFDYFKMESGNFVAAKVNFVLEDVFYDIVESFREKANSKGVEIIFNIGANISHKVIGDPLALEQILSHLLSNALKMTDKGCIIIKVASLKKGLGKETLIVSVEDTGVGIEGEKIENVFKCSTNLSNEEREKKLYGGLDLGLSICKRWVEILGGTIWVKSVSGGGCAVHFMLEVESVLEEKVNDELKEQIKSKLSEYNILVVDDNKASGKALTDLLSFFGNNALYVESAILAMELMEKKAKDREFFEIVFVDQDMPEMAGTVLAKLMMSDVVLQSSKIVLMLNAKQDLVTEQNIQYFINKPIRKNDLGEILKKILEEGQHNNGSYEYQVEQGYQEFKPIILDEDKKMFLASKLLALKQMVYKHDAEAEDFFASFSKELKSITELAEKAKNIEKNLHSFAFNSAIAGIEMIFLVLGTEKAEEI